jgi:hypothetical protein
LNASGQSPYHSVQHIKYGNAQPVKSKRSVGGLTIAPKAGSQFNIDNPDRQIIMAVSNAVSHKKGSLSCAVYFVLKTAQSLRFQVSGVRCQKKMLL